MEPALGIMAACIATYRPLFKTWGFGWGSTRRTTDAHNNYSLSRRRTGHWALSSERDLNEHSDDPRRQTFEGSDVSAEGHPNSELKIGKTVEIRITSKPASSNRTEGGSMSPWG
jgi:hypothetical protein